ncbi:MAG TPA: M20/M25/M40 family metallo-hydrolase, partial [Trueperaceae bacterium]
MAEVPVGVPEEAVRGYARWLAEREQEMIDMLAALVNFDTPSSRKDLLDTAMSSVEATCRATGAQVERVEQQEAGDHLVARWPGRGESAPTVLVLAHLDTVWPADETSRRPFAQEEGKLTGPGVFDMKAGLVQGLFAIGAFKEGASGGSCNVTLIVSSDEETGSRSSRKLIEAEAARSQVVLVVEPASGPKLKTARKGVGMY